MMDIHKHVGLTFSLSSDSDVTHSREDRSVFYVELKVTYCALGSSYVKGFYIYQICVVDMNVSADII